IDWNGTKRKSVKLTAGLFKKTDLTIILTHHSQYDWQWIVDHSKAVFDSRNATRDVKKNRSKIELL
ncbi:MAG: UDP-N-acetyl-D-glucosamine dehydrogenase, partial [candidate division Zixibacteria bacterium]|nr:UDP-N-acetyl-D-glucosamine dehydrogenase [candidate division Zixibacteria bacterium]